MSPFLSEIVAEQSRGLIQSTYSLSTFKVPVSHLLGLSLVFHCLKKRCDLFWKGLFTHRPITIVVRPSTWKLTKKMMMTAFLVVVHAWKKTQCGISRINLPFRYHVKSNVKSNIRTKIYIMKKKWQKIFQIFTLFKQGGRLLCGRAHFYYGTKRWSSQDENLRNVTVHMSSSKRVLYLCRRAKDIKRGRGQGQNEDLIKAKENCKENDIIKK